MEERIEYDENIELLIQLVPETNEFNFQYIIFDHENHEAVSVDCFDWGSTN